MDAQPDWSRLRVFLETARTGSFSAAAQRLSLHHTTIARQIAGLERQLESRLVDRHAQGIRLTPSGEVLLERALSVEEAVFAATRAVAGRDDRVEGTVTVTTLTELLPIVLPALQQIQGLNPGLELVLDTGESLRDLDRREADVAVRATMSPPEELIARPVGRVIWAPYALEHTDRWVRLPSSPSPGVDRWQRSHIPADATVLQARAVHTAVRAVELGLGAGLLPIFAGDAIASLHRVGAELFADEHVYVLVHPDLRRVSRIRAVVDALVTTLEQRLS